MPRQLLGVSSTLLNRCSIGMTDAKMCAENYAQYDRENTSIPGALGLGEAMASNISSAFYAFTFLMSVAFAVLSDAWLGRYITLCLSFW